MQINYLDLLVSRAFSGNTDLPPENIYLTIQDNIIGTAGNFVTLTGLPKSCKSTYLTAIIASAITNRPVFDFQLKLYPHLNKTKIAWFDTEQSAYDFSRSVKRIQEFTGLEGKLFEYMDCFLMNSDTSKDIINCIETYLAHNSKTGVLIIDGLLDLIDNFNSEEDSKLLTRRLKRWAKDNNILIITVLHLGKKDLTSIGHIGSASDRYAQSTLTIEKTKNNSFTCSGKYLRSAPGFTPIEIYFNQNTKRFVQALI
jgi:hypothetical protein